MKKQDEEVAVAEVGFDPVASTAKLKAWLPDLNPLQIAALVKYLGELIKFNRTINLVSANTLKNAEAIHFADSVLAGKLIGASLLDDPKVYDFGSGNGFPGLVLAMLFPKRQIILVDRDHRKLEFCKHAASAMALGNVTFENKNVEDIPDKTVGNAVARGFAPLQRSLLVCRKQFRKGGRFFHLKSDGWANELAALPSQFFTHWTPNLLGQYRVPESNNDNFVVMTEKVSD